MPMKGLILFPFPLEIKKEQNKVRNDDAQRCNASIEKINGEKFKQRIS